jgi:hypothetical protein
MKLRLKRFFVDGLPRGTSTAVSEFLLHHGVGSVRVIDRPEMEKIEVVCFHNERKTT